MYGLVFFDANYGKLVPAQSTGFIFPPAGFYALSNYALIQTSSFLIISVVNTPGLYCLSTQVFLVTKKIIDPDWNLEYLLFQGRQRVAPSGYCI